MPKQIEQLIIEYLNHASAETCYVVMHEYSREMPKASIIAWLKDNPQTEKATALMMYWMMHPRFSKQFTPEEATQNEKEKFGEEYYDLIEDLEQKYISGFYTNQQIGYDPYYDYAKESGYFAEKRKIPAEMYRRVQGTEIDITSYNRNHNLKKGLNKELYDVIYNAKTDFLTFSENNDSVQTPITPGIENNPKQNQDITEIVPKPEKTYHINVADIVTNVSKIKKIPSDTFELINSIGEESKEKSDNPSNYKTERPSFDFPDPANTSNTEPKKKSKGGCMYYVIVFFILIVVYNYRSCPREKPQAMDYENAIDAYDLTRSDDEYISIQDLKQHILGFTVAKEDLSLTDLENGIKAVGIIFDINQKLPDSSYLQQTCIATCEYSAACFTNPGKSEIDNLYAMNDVSDNSMMVQAIDITLEKTRILLDEMDYLGDLSHPSQKSAKIIEFVPKNKFKIVAVIGYGITYSKEFTSDYNKMTPEEKRFYSIYLDLYEHINQLNGIRNDNTHHAQVEL